VLSRISGGGGRGSTASVPHDAGKVQPNEDGIKFPEIQCLIMNPEAITKDSITDLWPIKGEILVDPAI